jgi:hypothetical protein
MPRLGLIVARCWDRDRYLNGNRLNSGTGIVPQLGYEIVKIKTIASSVMLSLIALSITGCGPRRYSIDPMAWGRPVRIDYEDFEELKEKELKDSKTMMREPYIKGIPAGGRIIVNIKGSTSAGTNTKYYSTRVEDPQGTVIVEEKGRNNYPHFNVRASYPWSNLMIVEVPTYIDTFATVRVFDHLSQERYDFKIEKRGNSK